MKQPAYLYKMTNIVTGEIYIGMSKGYPDQSYTGSGTDIEIAVAKYGRISFDKTILEVGEWEDIRALEELYVDERFVARTDTYNSSTGGRLANPYEISDETRSKLIVAGISGAEKNKELQPRRRDLNRRIIQAIRDGTFASLRSRFQEEYCGLHPGQIRKVAIAKFDTMIENRNLSILISVNEELKQYDI